MGPFLDLEIESITRVVTGSAETTLGYPQAYGKIILTQIYPVKNAANSYRYPIMFLD